ncbi:hypothetical protein [Williamsia sp. Leaf354]|nr:hypothetical protein [Williamsia sp. Leaf354]
MRDDALTVPKSAIERALFGGDLRVFEARSMPLFGTVSGFPEPMT